jgi:hypothetical protein
VTFEELMQKYLSLIQNVAAASGNPEVYESELAILALNVKPALRDSIPEENLDRGSMMAAIELVSRYLHPEGESMDGYEGGFNDNADIMAGADEEAPSVKVEVNRPGSEEMDKRIDAAERATVLALRKQKWPGT